MDLTLSRLEGIPITDELVAKPFTRDSRFNDAWWGDTARSPVAFYAFIKDALGEVARAQIKLSPTTWLAYPTYTRPHLDPTEIELFEVRPDQRGRRIGREAVALLGVEFSRPCIALSLDEGSDGFWHSLGWTAHQHLDAANHRPTRALFVQPD